MIVYYVPPWWQGAKSQQIYYCVVQYSICTYLVTIQLLYTLCQFQLLLHT